MPSNMFFGTPRAGDHNLYPTRRGQPASVSVDIQGIHEEVGDRIPRGASGKWKSRQDRFQRMVILLLLAVLAYIVFTRRPETFTVNYSIQQASEVELYKRRPADLTITAKCIFGVTQGKTVLGSFTVGLFGHTVPRTVENFKSFCIGWQDFSLTDTRFPKRLNYLYTHFYDVRPGHYIAGGDVLARNGTFGPSIYGPTFPDESYRVKHELYTVTTGPAPGLRRRHANGSRFLIVLGDPSAFDEKHVAFGKVIEGTDVLQKIADVELERGRPVENVFISRVTVE